MTTREIAELTIKEHSHVLRDAYKMLEQLGYTSEQVDGCHQTWVHPQNKQHYSELNLNREETLCLVSGYSAPLRMKIIKRLDELEKQVSAPQIPDFSNPAEAARAWAAQYESAQLAIATKAEIGSRREATAMNTASQAVKKVNALEIELDRSKQFSSVKRMEMLYHGQKFNWRELKSTCALMGFDSIDIFDANYGTVKAWPAEVWQEVYALEIL